MLQNTENEDYKIKVILPKPFKIIVEKQNKILIANKKYIFSSLFNTG